MAKLIYVSENVEEYMETGMDYFEARELLKDQWHGFFTHVFKDKNCYWYQSAHYGDCTKENISCITCLVEQYFKYALEELFTGDVKDLR